MFVFNKWSKGGADVVLLLPLSMDALCWFSSCVLGSGSGSVTWAESSGVQGKSPDRHCDPNDGALVLSSQTLCPSKDAVGPGRWAWPGGAHPYRLHHGPGGRAWPVCVSVSGPVHPRLHVHVLVLVWTHVGPTCVCVETQRWKPKRVDACLHHVPRTHGN